MLWKLVQFHQKYNMCSKTNLCNINQLCRETLRLVPSSAVPDVFFSILIQFVDSVPSYPPDQIRRALH